jgi:hypothetical protein
MHLSVIHKRYPDTIRKIFIDQQKGLDLQMCLKMAEDFGIKDK